MSLFSKLFSSRRGPAPKVATIVPHSATSLTSESADHSSGQAEIDWRTSEGHQRILHNFMFPNTPQNVSKWVDWDGLLGESVSSAIERLKTAGALLRVDEPTWRILYNRSANELKRMCREHQLKVSGTKEQMAERLASIDPSGLVLGYPGELLKCSPDAEQIANAGREAWERFQDDARELEYVFSREDYQAERQRLRQQLLRKEYPEPSADDVKWGLLNRRALQHANEGNLGQCANIHRLIGNFLARRGKLQDALRENLIVCAYDLNGAQNRGGVPAEILRQFPLFDPAMATLAPVVVENVRDLAEELEFSDANVQEIYLRSTSLMNFPLAPEKTWAVLSLAIQGKIDLEDQPRCFRRIRSLLV